jgi:hypothetical protein
MRYHAEAFAVLAGIGLQFASLLFEACAARAQAGSPGANELQRPAYQTVRFDEDWSVLRGLDLTATGDFWDRLKFIPITSDGSVWLSLGGQVRERGEYFRHSCSAPRHPRTPTRISSPGSC